MVTKPWSERTKTAQQLQMEIAGPLSQIPGVRAFPTTPPALPGGGDFPVDLVIASPGEPQQLVEIANQLVGKAFASGLFMFADADLKFDQPQAEVVFDRDKLRSQGVDLSQAGRDLSILLGGDYVNRFSIQGRSYKVIPQIERAERLTPDQLSQIYITGSGDKLVPLSTFATLKTTAEPRELKKFQQLNAVRIQGVIPPPVPLDTALGFLETEARAILPPGVTMDYAGESRQLRTEGSNFLFTFLLSAVLIYLVLAAQFESFRDPLIILAGSVPLAVAGALLFSFLGFTTLNIYSQVGLITLVGLVAKNGILIVQFANHLRETGTRKLDAIIEASGTRLRPILMTTAATVVGHFPARPGHRTRRRRAQQHRHHARQRHDHRHAVHAVRAAVDLHVAGGESGGRHRRGARARGDCRVTFHRKEPRHERANLRSEPCLARSTIALLWAVPAAAQTAPLALTLEDAVRRAVDNNPDLAVVRLESDVETARVDETRTAFTPVFSTVLGRSSTVTPPANFLLGERGVDVNDFFSSTGVRQRLPWGSGTWSISWDTSRTTTTNPLTSFDPTLQSGFELAFSQPLLRDRRVDSARYQYAIAKRNQDSSDLLFREAVVQTVAAVKQAYWTLKATRANVDVQQRSLDLARELARENKVRVDAGHIPPIDLVQAEAEVAQRRENLIRAHTAADDAEDALRRLIVNADDREFWKVRLEPVEESVGDRRAARHRRGGGERARPALRHRAGGSTSSRTRRRRSTFSTISACRTCASKRRIAATAWPARSSCAAAGSRDRSSARAIAVLATRSARCSPTTIRRGASASRSVIRSAAASRRRTSPARAVERRQTTQRIASLRIEAAETVRRAGRQVRSTAERVEAARAGASLAQERLDSEQTTIRRRPLDDVPGDAGAARSARSAGQPAPDLARLRVVAGELRGRAAGAAACGRRHPGCQGRERGPGAHAGAARPLPSRRGVLTVMARAICSGRGAVEHRDSSL